MQKIIIKDKIQLQHILFSHFLFHSFLRISEKFREKMRNTSEKDCKIRAKKIAKYERKFSHILRNVSFAANPRSMSFKNYMLDRTQKLYAIGN